MIHRGAESRLLVGSESSRSPGHFDILALGNTPFRGDPTALFISTYFDPRWFLRTDR